MSATMRKADGVTVLTLTSDPQSAWPPLCQILKGLCYSPVCCSLSQHLRRVQGTSQSALGALQIMVGLLSIYLADLLSSDYSSVYWWKVDAPLFPYWLGGLFTIFGTMSILSEKIPSPYTMLYRSINALLIVLSVLELCLVISSAVLGFKALRASGKGGNKSTDDPELQTTSNVGDL